MELGGHPKLKRPPQYHGVFITLLISLYPFDLHLPELWTGFRSIQAPGCSPLLQGLWRLSSLQYLILSEFWQICCLGFFTRLALIHFFCFRFWVCHSLSSMIGRGDQVSPTLLLFSSSFLAKFLHVPDHATVRAV